MPRPTTALHIFHDRVRPPPTASDYSLLNPTWSDFPAINHPMHLPSIPSEHGEEFPLFAGCSAALAIHLLGFLVYFARDKGDVPGQRYDGEDGEHPAEKVGEEDRFCLHGGKCVWGEDGTQKFPRHGCCRTFLERQREGSRRGRET